MTGDLAITLKMQKECVKYSMSVPYVCTLRMCTSLTQHTHKLVKLNVHASHCDIIRHAFPANSLPSVQHATFL